MDSTELLDVRNWVSSNDLSLLVFTTPDCGVCEALRPRVAALAQKYGRLQVRYVDAAASPETAGQYQVFAVPVYILSVRGREARRFARHFGIGELEEAVNRFDELIRTP